MTQIQFDCSSCFCYYNREMIQRLFYDSVGLDIRFKSVQQYQELVLVTILIYIPIGRGSVLLHFPRFSHICCD